MPTNPKLGQPQKGLIAALLCLAFGIAIFDTQSSRQPSPTAKDASAPERNNKQNNGRQKESEWMAADNWLAMFTLGLVIVGGIQVRLFWVQLRLIGESLIDAKKAADAAEGAAHAAIRQAKVAEDTLSKLERPWIFVDLVQDLRGSPDDEFQEPYALFDIVNHGRGPAIIEEFHGEINSNDLRPGAPLLRDEFHGIIGPGKAMEGCKIECPRGLQIRSCSQSYRR